MLDHGHVTMTVSMHFSNVLSPAFDLERRAGPSKKK